MILLFMVLVLSVTVVGLGQATAATKRSATVSVLASRLGRVLVGAEWYALGATGKKIENGSQ